MRPVLPLLLLLLAGCFSDRRPAQGPSNVEYSDQDEYAQTPSEGPGNQPSSGYYGVGQSEAPSHTPASPKPAQGGHQPY
jgi:hypothetical protein